MQSDIDDVELQFCRYQVDLPLPLYERIDVTWNAISKMKNSADELKYDKLSRIMFAVLSLSHSNADSERILSQVRKNKNECLSDMKTSTLSNFLSHKVFCQAQGENCISFKFDDKLLKKCQSATYVAKQESVARKTGCGGEGKNTENEKSFK